MKLSKDARAALRKAVTAHVGWTNYRNATGISSAQLSGDVLLTAARALNIDLATAQNAATEGAQTMTTPRPYGPVETDKLARRLAEVRGYILKSSDLAFVDDVFRTIRRQSGEATEKQFNSIERVIRAAERAKADNQRKDDGFNFDTKTETETSQTEKNETMTTATVSPYTPAVATSGDAAGAALANMVAPHLAALMAEHIAREVEARLATVPTVKITMERRDGTTFETDGLQHPKFGDLLRAASARLPNGFAPNIWLAGPTATGKTHAAGDVAKALGLPFYSHGAMAMAHELMGFIDANGHLHRTGFRDAFEHGGVVLTDEVDSWDQGATLALNGGLANGETAFPDGMVKRHRDCIIIAAGNTYGTGATADFVGRNRLDAAFMSRFAVKLDWHTDEAFERAISGNETFALRVQSARAKAKQAGLKIVLDARQMQAGAALIAAGFTIEQAAELTYLAGLSPEQRRMIID